MALGALIPMSVISLGLGRFAFRQGESFERATKVALTTWLICTAIVAFGAADGGPLRFDYGLYYLPGALLIWLVLYRFYERAERQREEK